MSKIIDMTGQKCGKLVVIERAPNDKNGRAMWRCKCECGNETLVTGKGLRNGHTKSCGHCGRPALIINEVGNIYGRLTVVKQAPKSIRGHAAWECLCECGNSIIVSGQDLRHGAYTSCGHCNDHLGASKNEIGKRYGRLVVLRPYTIKHGALEWVCKCDCGAEVVVRGAHLRTGKTQSCGCLKSQGEEKISNLLTANNIVFEKEKTFNNCKFPQTNSTPRFDFFVNNSYIIEYDGIQHFGKGTWGQDYENINKRDNYKNMWCFEHNIPIIRIPYSHFNKLCIEDLLLETSHFILKRGEHHI